MFNAFNRKLQDTVRCLSDAGKMNFSGILLQQLQDARIPSRRNRIKAKIMLSLQRRLARNRERDVDELMETSVSFKLRDIHQVGHFVFPFCFDNCMGIVFLIFGML